MSGLDDLLSDGSDEDTEAMTAAEVLKRLEETWLNEKFAPDLLENKLELVECMMDQIQEMEENIKRARKTDFKISIHRMEIDRIRYTLSSYIRSRLSKIEKYANHVLQQDVANSDNPVLSPEELQFAKELQHNLEGHLRTLALQHMPPNLQTLDPKQTEIKPNLDSYVFLRVNQNTDGVLVEAETLEAREEIIDMEAGDQHIMRYQPIAGLVANGTLSLI